MGYTRFLGFTLWASGPPRREWRVRRYKDKLHVVDKVRVKMGNYMLKYFQAEREQKVVLS